jgi:hypothetical protein
MCSSNSAGEIIKAYYSTCVVVADFVLITLFFTEMLPVEWSEGWLLARASFYRLCPHYIGCGFYLPATLRGDEHSLSSQ